MAASPGILRALPALLAAALAAPPFADAREHPPEINRVYEYKGEDMKAFGAEANADMSRLNRLFGMPTASGVAATPIEESEQKGWLGILMKLPAASAPQGEHKPQAIEVSRILPGSAAEAAQLQEGDLITGIDDTAIEGDENKRLLAFRTAVNQRHPGERVKLRFLHNGVPMERETALVAQPRSRAILKPHPDLEVTLEADKTPSLLAAALDKEKLTPEFDRLMREMRDETDKVYSPLLRKQGRYNPFRLQEVNYVMHHPLQLPAVARKITDRLHGSFDASHHDLAGLLRTAMDELDMQPSPQDAAADSPRDFSAYVEHLVRVIRHAQEERIAVLSALSPEDIDFLYDYAPQWLTQAPPAQNGDPPKSEKEPGDAEKRAEEDKRLRLLRLALQLDLPRLLDACTQVARALDPDALRALSANARLDHYPADWKVREQDNLTVIDTPAGRVLIGGKGDNTYAEDAMIIIDLGGNDRYLNHAGGSTRRDPFSVAIDLAGDDLYDAPVDISQGAGFLGAGFLLDLAGDDRYTAKNHAQGSGFLGAGMLVDLAGRDQYTAIAGAQGAGTFGTGMLAESGGNDNYSGSRFVQGFGYVQGFGAIVEVSGNDTYFAGGMYDDFRAPGQSYQSLSQGFGYGMRPFESLVGASGGIGVIAEAEGHDTYIADYFAQGSSYWFALGILDDHKGNDRYLSGRYSQGAGIHSTAGVLMDGAGDDSYFASYGVAQGCGHDYGAGFLLDNGGSDRYISHVTSQGAGNDNGLGVLSDNGGEDIYQLLQLGQGRGNFETARDSGSFGFLFDTGGGNDVYSLGGKNDSLNYKEQWGILLDKN